MLEIERKFLVHIPARFDRFPIPYNRVQIEQAYLLPDVHGPGSRIRRRGQDGGNTYYQTFKIASGNMSMREEREERITALKYRDLMEQRDPSRGVIRKERNCFLWKNQYFELDVFLEPEHLSGLTLLELELTEENSSIELPGWLGKITDVTEDPDYQNYNLAMLPGL